MSRDDDLLTVAEQIYSVGPSPRDPRAACARLGISTRTAQRYEARLRRQEAAA